LYQQNNQVDSQKQKWDAMTITYMGNVNEIVLGGGGKVSGFTGDGGESRKQKPSTTVG
jgi:hypothetical protein